MKVKVPEKGMAVISLQGRDKGVYYVIAEVLDGKASVVDGKKRKLQNPKIKNVKHLRLLPRNISEQGIVRDKSFDYRVAHYLKELAVQLKSEE